MKTLKLILSIAPFLLIGCTEDLSIPEKDLSEAVKKIETSYTEGADKFEGDTKDSKIETILNEADRKKIERKVEYQLSNNLKDLQDRYASAVTLFSGYDVGVIPNVNACPAWSEKININMDCEDSWPKTKWMSDPSLTSDIYCCDKEPTYRGAWSISSNKNLRMVFCRVDGREFVDNNNFGLNGIAVLRLGANAPSDISTVIERYFDNEDNNNANSTSGDISPNVENGNTLLNFYYWHGVGPPTSAPDLGFGYGVLGITGSSTYGLASVDDEDGNNANWLKVYGEYSWGEDYIITETSGNTLIWISKARD